MLVRCSKCRTTYKVSDDLLKGGTPAFRCSRCKHTFELELESTPDLSTDPALPFEPAVMSPTQDEELNLPFESKAKPVLSEKGKDETAELSPAKPGLSESRAAGDDPWLISDREDEYRFALPESEPPTDSGKVIDSSPDFPAEDPFFAKAESGDEADDPKNILAISSYREQKASIRPFVTLFALLVIGFILFSVVSYANPRTSEDVIRTIPLIGKSVLRNNHLKQGILVQSLRSSYQTIQGNRDVFLISGVALNQNPERVREIRLSGITYNNQGKELERQTIWVGNTISPRIIRGMTTEDIPHLQNLKPLKSFEIPPGDSIPFTIVFLKSAKSAREFSCDVLAAEGEI